jgi:CRP-like cAMP-binding protein
MKKRSPAFDVEAFLTSTGTARRLIEYRRRATIFTQGSPALHVLYLQEGSVKLTVVNQVGKEAVIAIFGPGDFFGEVCLAGQTLSSATATAIHPAKVLAIEKDEMTRLLHTEHAFSDRFIRHMLARKIRIEEDLVDQLFNSTEKRLARALLLLAHYGKKDEPGKILPHISQETLAQTIGTTRSRVNIFMNKFKTKGYIDTKAGLRINSSLVNVLLHDS